MSDNTNTTLQFRISLTSHLSKITPRVYAETIPLSNLSPSDSGFRALFPCIRLSLLSLLSSYALSGDLQTETALYQVNIYSYQLMEAERLINSIYQTLSGFRGTMGVVKVQEITMAGGAAGYEPETSLYSRRIDIRAVYSLVPPVTSLT